MIIRQSRFSFSRLSVVAVFFFLSSRVFSVEIPLEARSFTPVEGGEDFLDGVSLYLSSFDELAYSASNASDIVIIEDMTTLTVDENDEDNPDDDTAILVSNITGYNTVTDETLETGSLVFEVSVKESAFAASGVKGFYRKSGPWVERQSDQSFMLEGLSGMVRYTTLQKARDIDIVLNGSYQGEAFTIKGDSTSSVLTTEFVTIGGWSASEDSDYDFAFASATLKRDGNKYIGFLQRNDSEDPTEWESRYAVFQVTDTNDSDEDGIPDFSDLGAGQVLGILSTNSIDIGNGQYWSNDLATTISVDTKHFWIYGENIGWFYLPDQDDPNAIRVYIADERLGWLTTNEEMSPYYRRESDNVLVYFDRVDGNISFYDTGLEAWFTVNY